MGSLKTGGTKGGGGMDIGVLRGEGDRRVGNFVFREFFFPQLFFKLLLLRRSRKSVCLAGLQPCK